MTPLPDGALRLAAPAKINLNLLVAPRRGDGYHPLDSLVVKITLYDELGLRARDDGRVTFACEGAECGRDEDNLVPRAARLLAAGRQVGGVDIALTKRIPAGMGLGGGSSDAAATLVGLERLWGLALPCEALCEFALELGSDVPLFLGPPAARMTGRGEQLAPVQVHPFAALLVLPPFGCSTAEVYRAFDAAPGEPHSQLPAELLREPPSCWRGRLLNQLAPAARRVQPQLAEVLSRLEATLPLPVCVTGSGSAMFALCDDRAEAAAMLSHVPDDLRELCVTVESNPW